MRPEDQQKISAFAAGDYATSDTHVATWLEVFGRRPTGIEFDDARKDQAIYTYSAWDDELVALLRAYRGPVRVNVDGRERTFRMEDLKKAFGRLRDMRRKTLRGRQALTQIPTTEDSHAGRTPELAGRNGDSAGIGARSA